MVSDPQKSPLLLILGEKSEPSHWNWELLPNFSYDDIFISISFA